MYPVVLGYDDSDRLVELRTFRTPGEIITSDPISRGDYDSTKWEYDPATGVKTAKDYISQYVDNCKELPKAPSLSLSPPTPAKGKDCEHKKTCISIIIAFYIPMKYKGNPWNDPQAWGKYPDPDLHGIRNENNGADWMKIPSSGTPDRPADPVVSGNVCYNGNIVRYCCCQYPNKKYPSIS